MLTDFKHRNPLITPSLLKSPKITSIVMFAQAPPPEHGQSKMVQLALEALRERPDQFEVYHINARFSHSLEDIGESSFIKLLLTAKYLSMAVLTRFRTEFPILYYVPGPVKWSSILRDWILLSILRLFYRRVIFHWHAIGQGEWANGSQRLQLHAPRWLELIARKISSWILYAPFGSISVSQNSRKDAVAISSLHQLVVCNGIEDPCPDFEETEAPCRLPRSKELKESSFPCFKILFLSHGTIQKGVTDSLLCMEKIMGICNSEWKFELTFAGGISEAARPGFDQLVGNLLTQWPDRIVIRERGYLTGSAKTQCFRSHDVFLAPSRWESFGLTVIEAMAHGLSIVAADSDGVRGVLPENYPFLGRVADPLSLAICLQECCNDLVNGNSPATGKILRKRFLDSYQIHQFSLGLTGAILSLDDNHDVSAIASRAIPLSTVRETALRIRVYLADQNPGYDRSFGISRMSRIILESLHRTGEIWIEAIVSTTSQKCPPGIGRTLTLPWGTRRKWMRLVSDHLHPLLTAARRAPDIYYFPKGHLPYLDGYCHPSVVTIHDTIIQYDKDRYPDWRAPWDYDYWARILRHTLANADRILTVSKFSKKQIVEFMERHHIPRKAVTVTYEPCAYEHLPQPELYAKGDHVMHLSSVEPHKRTVQLVHWWLDAENSGQRLPSLHLIGALPEELLEPILQSRTIIIRPFLDDKALQETYRSALALLLPSEIEGFGLPALEAYYLGTPVCFVRGTSVEEILDGATSKGGYELDDSASFFAALEVVMAMTPAEVRDCGLRLRETYASEKVTSRIISVFEELRDRNAYA